MCVSTILMKKVKIIIKNLQRKIPISPGRMKRVILDVLSLEGFRKSCEITAAFVTDRQIHRLNARYLGKDNPTDVLAFDMSVRKQHLFADIVISTDTAIKNARIFKTSVWYELHLYLIHGVLHLIGYDDKTEKETIAMNKKAVSFLSTLNLTPNTKHPALKTKHLTSNICPYIKPRQ